MAVFIGRYRVGRELGAGGMGVVYEAHDPVLDRKVALKLLRPGLDEARLSREARALAKLSHPNVVAVYDVGEMEGRTFLAMELVDGVTLKSWMTHDARSVRELLAVLLHAGNGLAAAHAAGLVHRDFKPENVIVGSDGRVRVLDFGIVSPLLTAPGFAPHEFKPARSPEDEAGTLIEAGRLTADGSLIGTPAYMAPEQLRSEALDERADQFSFCVVAWEALYGARPFCGREQLELLRGGRACLPSPTSSERSVPTWLRRILERGLAMDRAARYPSMGALLELLAAGLAREAAGVHVVGRRYERLRFASGGAAGELEPAVDRLSGRLMTLQRLDRPAQDPSAALAELRARFRALAPLRHPHVCSVVDVGCEPDGALYVVWDVPEPGAELRAAAHESRDKPALDGVLELLRALSYLHVHGIYLGALAASDVRLIDGQVKLLPLGFMVDGPCPPSCEDASEGPAVRRATVARDLATCARFACDLLSGASAWEADSRDLPEIEREVLRALQTLLEPSPRLTTAEEVIAALALASGRAISLDSAETRESRLRTAPLEGRQTELAVLEEAVAATCRGRGGAWLIGGESGAGKSRLLSEVRTLGTLHGALVLRGQEESQGGAPYRLFRQVLRSLVLLADLDDYEAGVLAPIVPELSKLLGRPIRSAPEVDVPSTHVRVHEVVEALLRRQEAPLVLLLEDLHWLRSDSLQLLQSLIPLTERLPLLIVASFRNDESPTLSAALPNMQTLTLKRLDRVAIAALARAMIGPTGTRDEVVGLLCRDTEGNAFFLVEAIRALAEEAGGSEHIGQPRLPESVFAGGIRRVVQRRLMAVSDDARALLQLAAVIGRNLDTSLLRLLAPEVDVEAWQTRCIQAAVLERSDEEVRFAHDKLREGLLSALEEAERVRLHARVAEAMERAYAERPDRLASLAYHFREARDEPKEALYAQRAGEQAVAFGALREGIELLERTRQILLARGPARFDLLVRGGAGSALGRVSVSLSNAYYHSTDLAQALLHVGAALRAVGVRAPAGAAERAVALLWHLAMHLLYRVAPRAALRAGEQRRADALVASRAAAEAATIHISLGDEANVLLFSLMALNFCQRAESVNLNASGVLGYALTCLGWHRAARSYFTANPGDSDARSGSYVVLKSSYLLGTGEIAAAQALLRADMEVVERTGFKTAAAYDWFLLGYCAYYRGQLREAEQLFGAALTQRGTRFNFIGGLALVRCLRGQLDDAEALAREAVDAGCPPAPRAIALGVLALVQVRRGKLDAALECARAALASGVKGFTFGYAGAGFFAGVLESQLAELQALRARGAPTRAALRTMHRLLRQSRAWARSFRVGAPQTLLYQGRLDWLLGRHERARAAFHESLRLSEQMGLKLYAGFARLALARTGPANERHQRQQAQAALARAGVLLNESAERDAAP